MPLDRSVTGDTFPGIKTISVKQLDARTGHWVRSVQNTPVVVTDRGARIAVLQPLDGSASGRRFPKRDWSKLPASDAPMRWHESLQRVLNMGSAKPPNFGTWSPICSGANTSRPSSHAKSSSSFGCSARYSAASRSNAGVRMTLKPAMRNQTSEAT
ncbi:MAG: type II toxin-antitoxin system Phd/YefM family antitoxin [Verrucomicrobia bacterium]|nr:type II toxin-antitoxin system Phd/YefM family antitoxin [Verrucomicrobiota bacterium]